MTPTATLKAELDGLIKKYADYENCEEWHIHQNDDGIPANADATDGHKEFDEDKFRAAILATFATYIKAMKPEKLEVVKSHPREHQLKVVGYNDALREFESALLQGLEKHD